MLLCCTMTCVCYGLLCFRLLPDRFLIGYCLVLYCLIICRSNMCLSSVSPPHTAGFLIVNIQHVEYLRFAIEEPQTFFRADSVTLNTPHTTWKYDKIIFRSTKITGHYLGLSEGEKSAQNQPDYLLVCTQHYSVLCIFSFKLNISSKLNCDSLWFVNWAGSIKMRLCSSCYLKLVIHSCLIYFPDHRILDLHKSKLL